MWHITSNNVQRAKERLQLRRAEIETRYAEEKKALDAEFAVIETLESAASDFMLKLNRENGAIPLEPQRRPTRPAAMNKTTMLRLSQKRLSWWRRSICPPAAKSAAARRSSFRSPSRRATRSRWRNRRRSGHPQTRIALAALPRQSCLRPRRHRRRRFPQHGVNDGSRSGKPTVLGPSPRRFRSRRSQLPSTLRGTRAFGFVRPSAPKSRGLRRRSRSAGAPARRILARRSLH
jgi:hypothetical protein